MADFLTGSTGCSYKPTWNVTTTSTAPTTTSNYTYSIGSTNIKTKITLDGEELNSDDIKFLHELKNRNERENKNMDMNFHFGPCGDRAKISHFGIAVKDLNNSWVSYNKNTNEIVNVDPISFGDGNYVYMIPVALKEIKIGDVIIHNKHIMFVKAIKNDGLKVIDITAGEEKKILPTKSIFGFDFITKLVSLIDFSNTTASEDNPFGNMLPFLLLNDNKKNDILPLIFMMNNEISNSFTESPWMMALLMNQKTY